MKVSRRRVRTSRFSASAATLAVAVVVLSCTDFQTPLTPDDAPDAAAALNRAADSTGVLN